MLALALRVCTDLFGAGPEAVVVAGLGGGGGAPPARRPPPRGGAAAGPVVGWALTRAFGSRGAWAWFAVAGVGALCMPDPVARALFAAFGPSGMAFACAAVLALAVLAATAPLRAHLAIIGRTQVLLSAPV